MRVFVAAIWGIAGVVVIIAGEHTKGLLCLVLLALFLILSEIEKIGNK